MLVDRPDLMDRYRGWMDAQVTMRVERSAIPDESGPASQLGALRELNNNLETNTAQPVGPRKQSLSPGWFPHAFLIAACIALVFFALPVYFWHHSKPLPMPDSTSTSVEGTWRIPKITRVSWEGPLFAAPEHADNSATPKRAGLVSLGVFNGFSVNGYILRLEPGVSAELMMAADAYSENNPTVTQLRPDGTPVLRNVSFNNFGAGEVPPREDRNYGTRRFGLIGTWSVFNDSNTTKHILIHGIHRLGDPDSLDFAADSEFFLSDMVVLLEEPDLVLIGCDDGGFDPNNVIHGVGSDGDYDDVTVMIRLKGVSNVNPDSTQSDRNVSLLPEKYDPPHSDCAAKHKFSLIPGEILTIRAACHATFKNLLYLLDDDSSEVLWTTRNTCPGAK